MTQFDDHIFSDGLVQPPSICVFCCKVSVNIDASQRFHANLCLVIDVSGSMQLPAALKDREAMLGWEYFTPQKFKQQVCPWNIYKIPIDNRMVFLPTTIF